jgi:uncharacterized 2Fe-2S/4Fe-4S cluster protein (DUF4445 family)
MVKIAVSLLTCNELYLVNNQLKQLGAKAGTGVKNAGGGKVDKAAGVNKEGIPETNAIKKQRMEAKRKEINNRIEQTLKYLVKLRTSSYICQTTWKGKYGLTCHRQAYVDAEG